MTNRKEVPVNPNRGVKEEAGIREFRLCMTDMLMKLVLIYSLIIPEAGAHSISNQGQNTTETDINFSESFIYLNSKKVYYNYTP